MMSPILPRLRSVEIYPVSSNGTKAFCFRDPEGYQESPVFLSPEASLVAIMLDGASTMGEIQEAFTKTFGGQKLKVQDIQEIIQTLEECLLLNTKHFQESKARVDAAFKVSRTRDPYFAGSGYPKEAGTLVSFLNELYLDSRGPGSLPAARSSRPLAGLIVPHIDFHRGGWCYAHGYKALAEASIPKRILLLGVAHAGSPTPFIFCGKPYRTPLGDLPLDQKSLDRLSIVLGEDIFEHEALHRTEHSLEFQAVWLSHLYPPEKRPMVLPVLAASFGDEKHSESPVAEAERVIEVLEEVFSQPDSLVLAGVDLSHVGPRFGDKEPLDEVLAQKTQKQDALSLDCVTESNARKFWRSVVQDGNKRNICGLSAIYTALRILGKRKGHILAYGQALDPAGGIVSFTSVSFPQSS